MKKILLIALLMGILGSSFPAVAACKPDCARCGCNPITHKADCYPCCGNGLPCP